MQRLRLGRGKLGQPLREANFSGVHVRGEDDTPVVARLEDHAPHQHAGLDGAIWGFAVETGTHLLRLITKGVFDRFPNLKMVVGHLGEALPFWMYRLDYMHAATVKSGRYEAMKPIELKPVGDIESVASPLFKALVLVRTLAPVWKLGANRIAYVREGTDDATNWARVEWALRYPGGSSNAHSPRPR